MKLITSVSMRRFLVLFRVYGLMSTTVLLYAGNYKSIALPGFLIFLVITQLTEVVFVLETINDNYDDDADGGLLESSGAQQESHRSQLEQPVLVGSPAVAVHQHSKTKRSGD